MDSKKRLIFLGIWGATFTAMFGDTIPQSFQPLFITGLGISPAVVGLVYNIRNVEQTLLRLISGSLSDVFGRKKLIFLGLAFLTFVPFIYYLARDATLPLIAMFVSGLGVSVLFPPAEAYASSLYPPEKAGTAMGRFHMGWATSSIIGPSVGGFLALYFPEYRPIFLIAGALTGTSIIIFWLFTRDDVEHSNGEKMSGETLKLLKEFPSTMRRMLSNRRVFVGSVAVFSHAFCHFGLITFIPLFGANLGFNEVSIGLALTANALVMAVGLPIVGTLSDRIGRFIPIVIGLLISVVAFGLLPSTNTPLILVILMATLGLCAVLEFPISQAVTMEALPVKDRGSATGVWGMTMSLGGTLGVFADSYILTIAPIEWIFYFCAVSSLIASLVIIMMKSFFKA
jgi:MFS family permease